MLQAQLESANDNRDSIGGQNDVSVIAADAHTETSGNASSTSSDALANKLSSSLACIAKERRSQLDASRAKAEAEDASSNNSSEEVGGQSSSSNNSGPAMVTGTTATSSSGDVRDSNNSSSDSNEGRKHHHHHQQHHTFARRQTKKQPENADGYGLPVPKDDRLQQAESAAAHAAVVAQLPPPTDSTTSDGAGSDRQGNEERIDTGSLLQPHREPGFHTIRRTFNRVYRREESAKSSETDSSENPVVRHKVKKQKRSGQHAHAAEDNDDNGGNGSSSGSGTEGGYAGSASSNENAAQVGSCSSPSVSSEESHRANRKRVRSGAVSAKRDPGLPLISKKESSMSVSSEIADFSSSEGEAGQRFADAFRQPPSRSPSITSSSDEQEESYPSAAKVARKVKSPIAASLPRSSAAWPPLPLQLLRGSKSAQSDGLDKKPAARRLKTDRSETPLLDGKPPILAVGSDVMAHILTFLEPPDILDVLTMPLSKDWLSMFTRQPELWRVLCLLEPFKATIEDEEDDSSDESIDSYSINVSSELRGAFGKFRLLYTSFVRCMRYLARIKEDAQLGRPPSVIDYGAVDQITGQNVAANRNLQQFLARARGVVVGSLESGESDISDEENGDGAPVVVPVAAARVSAVGVADDGSSTEAYRSPRKRRSKDKRSEKDEQRRKKKVKYAHSTLTQRLLGPTAAGTPGNVELPWSCTIYSIVNWMVAFSNVEGIQTMCLKVLPFLLEDEQQRMTAQRAGLTDIVLRSMVVFPDSSSLHTAAFHTIVLLARPLGGREGMLFHTSMVNSSGIFGANENGGGTTDGRSGIAVMLDSMRRFQSNELLQAMSCWSLVNIALAPAQKEMLVKLGGIQVTTNSMIAHPFNAEVQFRALFALINLVIPSVSLNANEGETDSQPLEDSSEKEVLDEMVDQVIHLVVSSMKNFCASEAILNRACLVLHNLSLTQGTLNVVCYTSFGDFLFPLTLT